MPDRWFQAIEEAERYFKRVPSTLLSEMSVSSDAATRCLAVALIRKQVRAGEPLQEYIPILRSLVADPDHDCRSQSQIELMEVIWSGDPEIVWEVIVEHADSEDEDLRGLIGSLLLEDLLIEHFDEYFPRVREMALNGSPRTLDTISTCWLDTDRRKRQLRNLVHNARRGRSEEE